MGLTYQMKMKIPFDMADMNGHIKLPDVILLSLQVSGLQSIDLGISNRIYTKKDEFYNPTPMFLVCGTKK